MEMTEFEERLWDYMVKHKTPVTIKKMAKYWICSESRVRKSLDKFVAAGIADLVKDGQLRFYKVKD